MKYLGNSIIVGRLDKGLVFSLVMEGLTNIQVDIPWHLHNQFRHSYDESGLNDTLKNYGEIFRCKRLNVNRNKHNI